MGFDPHHFPRPVGALFGCTVHRMGVTSVIELRGELDLAARETLDAALDSALHPGPVVTLVADLDAVTSADAVIAVTPVFAASYAGLFKSFFDLLEPDALAGVPVLVAATGGTERHSLALEHAIGLSLVSPVERRHGAFRRGAFDECSLRGTFRDIQRGRGELVDEPLGGGLLLDLGEQLHWGNIDDRTSHVVGRANELRSSLRMSPE